MVMGQPTPGIVPTVWLSAVAPSVWDAEQARQHILLNLGAREFVMVPADQGFLLFYRLHGDMVVPDPTNPYDFRVYSSANAALAFAEFNSHPLLGTGIVTAGSGEVLIVWWRR